MKSNLTAKKFRHCAAAVMAAIAIIILIAPYVGATVPPASPYVVKVAKVNEYAPTSITGVRHVDADNMMIYLLNRMYPVGSVFMWVPEASKPGEPQLNSKANLELHFGGEWQPFAQGRILVGAINGAAGGSAYAIGTLTAPNIAHGTMGGAGSSSILANVPLSNQMTGIGISSNPKSLNNDQTVGRGTPGLALQGTYTATHSATVTSTNFLSHTHTAAIQHNFGNRSSSNGNNASPARDDAGLGGRRTGNTNAAGTNASAVMSGTTSFTLGGSISFSSFPNPVWNPAPSITHQQQAVVMRELNLRATGTVSTNDTTVQPYQTCFMFIRTQLATYNP